MRILRRSLTCSKENKVSVVGPTGAKRDSRVSTETTDVVVIGVLQCGLQSQWCNPNWYAITLKEKKNVENSNCPVPCIFFRCVKLHFFKTSHNKFKICRSLFLHKASQIWTLEQVHGKGTFLKQQKTISIHISPTSKGRCYPHVASVPRLVKLAHPPEFIS